jgi:hypothetical protein
MLKAHRTQARRLSNMLTLIHSQQQHGLLQIPKKNEEMTSGVKPSLEGRDSLGRDLLPYSGNRAPG